MKRYGGSHQIENTACHATRTERRSQGWTGITQGELAIRLLIETRHDAGAVVALGCDLDAERDARAGRCNGCGELIGPVDQCPICHARMRSERQNGKGGR